MPLKYQSVAFLCIVKMLIQCTKLSQTWRTFFASLYNEGVNKQHDIFVDQYISHFVMIRDQMNQWVVKSYGVLPILCAMDALKQCQKSEPPMLIKPTTLENLVSQKNDSIANNQAVCLHMFQHHSREKVIIMFLQNRDIRGYPPKQFIQYALMDIDVPYFSNNTLFTLPQLDVKTEPLDLSFLPARVQQYVPVLSHEIRILSYLTHLLDNDRYLYSDYRAKQIREVQQNTLFILNSILRFFGLLNHSYNLFIFLNQLIFIIFWNPSHVYKN